MAVLKRKVGGSWVPIGSPEVAGTGLYLRDIDRKTRTTGHITLNTVGPTDVDTGLDLTLDAAAGDVVEYGISGLVSAAAQFVAFDVYTIVGGVPVNSIGPGLGGGTFTPGGVQAWYCTSVASEINLSGTHPRVLVGGDIANSTVTLRLRYIKLNTTARVLYANADNPLTVFAQVWTPFAAASARNYALRSYARSTWR